MQTGLQSDSDFVRDLERVRFVSGNFENLQGLRTAWLGLAALISGLGPPFFMYVFSSRPDGKDLVWEFEFSLVVLIITASYFGLRGLKDWYRKRFGIIRAKHIPLTWLMLVMVVFGVMDVFGITRFLHLSAEQLVYVVVGLSWFMIGLWRPQTDRLVLGLGILVLGAFQQFFPPTVGSVSTSFIICGVATLIAGLLDHRLLVDTLGAAQDDEISVNPCFISAPAGKTPAPPG